MNIKQLIKDRGAGVVRITTARNWGWGLPAVLSSMGLEPKPEWLQVVDEKEAIEILEAILWKDLAYKSELMARDQARRYGESFVKTFVESDSKIYSNGSWQLYHVSNTFSFNSMTEATLDAGILVVHRDYAACLWVEDED